MDIKWAAPLISVKNKSRGCSECFGIKPCPEIQHEGGFLDWTERKSLRVFDAHGSREFLIRNELIFFSVCLKCTDESVYYSSHNMILYFHLQCYVMKSCQNF
ncbi:unnamed protein product [Rhizophagus irregularis]|nr:unnamed protein product [Rhizophagus irregularis]